MNQPITKKIVVTTLAFLATACAVGPDFQRPAPPTIQEYTSKPLPAAISSADTTQGQSQQFVAGMDIPGQWWTVFHSPALNRLVEQSLKSNPSLAAALATLRQAGENVYAAEGTLFPAIDANGSVVRQQTTGTQNGPAGNPELFTLYNASVTISYGLDVFGEARRALEAIGAQEEFERFQLEAAYLTLTSNVVTTAVQEASLRAQIATTRELVDIESQQFDMLQKQYGVGAVSQSSVLAQQTLLAQTRANLPQLEKQLAQIRNQLAALSGKFPSQYAGEFFDLDTLELPQQLPVSLPSKLVEQRPDIRASESLLHAASAEVGVATASMFPQVAITGAAGSSANTAGELFSAGSKIWDIGARLTQPLFRGGTLMHQRRAAIAAFDSAAAQYRSTVLAAFQDVANVLDALQSDAAILQAQTAASQSANESLDITRKQYQIGAASYQALLNAQLSYQQTQIALVQARATRYADTAALFQSLGGGWWNRTDTAAEPESGAKR
jgi:NodT family efflux transporter outer membrane factor (OMF) lipoprotein